MVRTARITAAYLALLAMMLHAFVPAGWMPAQASTPGLHFTICSVGMPMPAQPSQQPIHPSPAHGNSVCPFAGLMHFASLTAVQMLVPRRTEAVITKFAASSAPFVTTMRDWNRTARAPPQDA